MKTPYVLPAIASSLACLMLGFWLGRRHDIATAGPNATTEVAPRGLVRSTSEFTQAPAEGTPTAPASQSFSMPTSGSLSERLDAVRSQGMPFSAAAALVLISQMKAGETLAVYEWLAQNAQGHAFGNSRELGPLWQTFWMRHGEVELEGALAKSKLPAGTHFGADRVLKHIFEGLAKVDPAAAGQALRKLSDPGDMAWAVEGLSVRWAQIDTTAATRWSLRQEDPEFRRNALRMIPFGILDSGQGLPGLTAWWQALPPDDQAAGWTMAGQPLRENPDSVNLDPKQLWDFLQAGRASGLQDPQMESIWISAAARSNRSEAAQLIQQLPDPAARARLEKQLDLATPRKQ